MKKSILGALLLLSTLSFSQKMTEHEKDSIINKAIGFDFKSLPKYSGIVNTNETIPLFDIPNLVKGNSLGNFPGNKLTILRKENDKYYLVKYNNRIGYIFVGYIMRYGTFEIKKKK